MLPPTTTRIGSRLKHPAHHWQDVSHLASVSGGAYTAACYATHLLKLAEEAPPPGAAGSGGLDRWWPGA